MRLHCGYSDNMNSATSKWAGWGSRSLKVDGAWAYVWVKRDADGGWTAAWESIPCGDRQVSTIGTRRDALNEIASVIRAARASVKATTR